LVQEKNTSNSNYIVIALSAMTTNAASRREASFEAAADACSMEVVLGAGSVRRTGQFTILPVKQHLVQFNGQKNRTKVPGW
jgi:hypothetical protein